MKLIYPPFLYRSLRLASLTVAMGVLAGCSTIEVPLGSIFGDATLNKTTASTFEPLPHLQTAQVERTPLGKIGTEDEVVTGSLPAPSTHMALTQDDWDAAVSQLQNVLDTPGQRESSNTNTVWLNAKSGAFGSIQVPPSQKTLTSGEKCRAFYISLARSGGQDWLRGAACKTAHTPQWDVRDVERAETPH